MKYSISSITPRGSPSDAHTAQNGQRVRKSTDKVRKSNTEPFRAVLLDVMNSTTRFDNIFYGGDIYGKKTET